ncbi:CTP synthetase [Mycoplasmopsis californica]|uniref:CTP synthase (glutamine hydrolyzing) n=1 Tax=Mycoplasmopsis equigenitalium TaxID=114883 RepID=A0ABY5J190_9BACT|nr:CTP synthase [Mycoplasmopsis equigenitalium]UUD36750.1 CTP synthase [Mycoplasmopsis equigenitalium]VEU69955.1 CTP synthetase [Mycoplasmopsis californica]
MAKYIFITGGVISGLGKGVIAASIGNLLKSHGYKIFNMKLDPYLNIDTSVMSPIEHGEVYVTNDGHEGDLDLGHYERFIGNRLTKLSNSTSGRIYQEIFRKEREGYFDGKTVQIIPHVTSEIKNIILNKEIAKNNDFVIIEIGGTVGDFESESFIYAISQLSIEMPNDVFYAHLTYVPYLKVSNEFKTKPLQNSVSKLRSLGINPNMLFLRADNFVGDEIKNKISKASFIATNNIIDVPDMNNIYSIPLYLNSQKVFQRIQEHFDLKNAKKTNSLDKWKNFVELFEKNDKQELKLLMVGKYTQLHDAYLSIIEALKIAATYKHAKVNLEFIDSSSINFKTFEDDLKAYDGVVILPGFGKRGFEEKVKVASILAHKQVPTLGICLGMQAMTVAHARAKGYADANSREFDEKTKNLVFNLVKSSDPKKLGGTLRVGGYDVQITKNTIAHQVYNSTQINERHRHRYEITKDWMDKLQDENFIFSGIYDKEHLGEICELQNHPFYFGVQYHPEFNTTILTSHPLFDYFINKVIEQKGN